MKTSKKYFESVAHTLYKQSLTSGQVDEKKIKLILTILAKEKPAGQTQILKAYKRLITNKLNSEEIIIETNDKITLQKNTVDNLKKKTGAKRVIYKTNKDITFGARITHGDWIWDDTLEGKLKQLTN